MANIQILKEIPGPSTTQSSTPHILQPNQPTEVLSVQTGNRIPSTHNGFIRIDAIVLLRFETEPGLNALNYSCDLKLRKNNEDQIASVTIERNFVPSSTSTNQYSEILNLVWSDPLGDTCLFVEDDDQEDQDAKSSKGKKCNKEGKGNKEGKQKSTNITPITYLDPIHYAVWVRLNTRSQWDPVEITAEMRSLTATVYLDQTFNLDWFKI